MELDSQALQKVESLGFGDEFTEVGMGGRASAERVWVVATILLSICVVTLPRLSHLLYFKKKSNKKGHTSFFLETPLQEAEAETC